MAALFRPLDKFLSAEYSVDEEGSIAMNCPYCGHAGFRSSHLRLSDLPRLVLLRLPARCQLCRERFSVSLSLALRMRRAVHAARQNELQNSR